MTWIKLDDNAPEHPKVAVLSDRAFRWWVRGLCYASRFLTDGLLPFVFTRPIPQKHINELRDAGLWEITGDGIHIHDYAEHQSAKADVKETREANRERQRRYKERRQQASGNAPVTPPVTLPNALPNALPSVTGDALLTRPENREQRTESRDDAFGVFRAAAHAVAAGVCEAPGAPCVRVRPAARAECLASGVRRGIRRGRGIRAGGLVQDPPRRPRRVGKHRRRVRVAAPALQCVDGHDGPGEGRARRATTGAAVLDGGLSGGDGGERRGHFMTQLEAMDQFDRLAAAGFLQPSDPDGKPGAVFGEWYDGLKTYALDDVKDGISRLLQTRTDRFWPTVGELRGCIASVTAGREKRRRCQTCQDAGWVEARPYKANAGHIYEGVSRCYACGVPAPNSTSGAFHTPLTDREFAEWQRTRRPLRVITSRDELFARIREVLGGRVLPPVVAE